MSFWTWYNEADMPAKVDGKWIDLETGIPFASEKKPRSNISKTAQSYRDVAKMFGGKALTGSLKQKEWAEKIRAEKLKQLCEEEAVELVTSGAFLDTARFWIDNRNNKFTLKDVVESVSEIKALKNKHYDVLARTSTVAEKEAAKTEIINVLLNNKVIIECSFPNFDVMSKIRK